MTANNNKLTRFGFSFKVGSVHTKRTIMLNELNNLLTFVIDNSSRPEEYYNAVYYENCTRKPTVTSRKYTATYLKDLYILDIDQILFRVLLYFWRRDVSGRPVIAFLCAYTRDSILRNMTEYVLSLDEGNPPNKEKLEECIENTFPDRFSPIMRASLGRNLLSSWTQAGYLVGNRRKVRTRAIATPGSVSYALLLGYLNGFRGDSIFRTEYVRLLDCSFDKAIELAEDASRRGWIVFKRVGDVIEVLFPSLITEQEMEWVREQS